MEPTLWDLAVEDAQRKKTASSDDGDVKSGGDASIITSSGDDTTILIMGSKNSGKTSVILRFLDRDETPKATTALEYTFGRRAKGHNIAKDVGHIWELGGGTFLSRLIDIPVNIESIRVLSLVVVLDLSRPHELWVTMETLLAVAKKRIHTILTERIAKDQNFSEELKQRAWKRVGEGHPDKDMMEPFPVPLVLLGMKYDIFQDFDSERRKTIAKTLRFLAHINGATLHFVSNKMDALMNRTRATMSHLVFGTSMSKASCFDHNKPLMVPAGSDSFQQIGPPPLAEGDLGRISAKSPIELWKHAYTTAFPQEAASNPSLSEDPAADPQYSQPAVDAMRKQKDEELQRYKYEAEKRSREVARKALSSATL